MPLTDLAVRKAKPKVKNGEPVNTLLNDGLGLYLEVDKNGNKRWTFIFQWLGKRAQMGFGPLADVSLVEARDLRDAARKLVAAGKNPIEERKREREEKARAAALVEKRKTFGEWAEEVAPAIGPRAKKAREAWVRMMQFKVGDLAGMAPADIQTEHVLAALKPYWVSRPESGKRMRQRIERVLGSASSADMIPKPWENPARLKDHLENLLERRAQKVTHRIALPYAEIPAFMTELRQVDRLPARALELCILTATRNIEARGARLGEFDRKAKIWTIPAERMKGTEELRREHRVGLTPRALEILDEVWPENGKPTDFLFPCARAKLGIFSENALQNVVKDMGFQGRATVHGFRSTFRDWAGDCTNFSREVIEQALAHKIEDDTERAYRRSDALAKRTKLMEAWAGYLARPAAAGNVAQFQRQAG